MRYLGYGVFGLTILLLSVGYNARPIARCGIGTCFIGVVTNQEFKLW